MAHFGVACSEPLQGLSTMPDSLQLLRSKAKTSTWVTFYSKGYAYKHMLYWCTLLAPLGKVTFSPSFFFFFFFFFNFYMIQLDLSYLLISKCIITGLMFISFSDCHKDSCFVGTATFLAPGIQSDIWWVPRKYSLNGEMNCTNLSHLLIPRSYCRKIRWAFSPLSLASWGPCPEDKDLLV